MTRFRGVASLAVLICLLATFLMALPAAAEEETREQKDARMKWWREARFGMFIHWGLYAVPAGTWNGKQIGGIGEWIMHQAKIPVKDYAALAGQFNPVKFNADEWVSIAKNAGMKYIIITSKHHDGFAMFKSAASPFNIYDATPFKRDPLAELAEACRRQGIKLGFYYSEAQDWHHPGGAAAGGHWDPAQDGDMDEYIRKIAVPQVREILSNYGPLGVLWWDTPTGMTPERARQFLPLLKLQPGIITNNRLGGGFPGDTETPEQHIPATGYKDRDWETCMTMNDTWGYKSYDNNWKSVETLLRNLVDIASKGGNYLLNVGPTAEGVIPQPSVERLAAIGKWLEANGESIYATTAGPFKKLPWGRCTTKPGKLYLHVFHWPADGVLNVPMSGTVLRAYLLSEPEKALTVSASDRGCAIQLPATAPDPIDTVVVAEVSGTVEPLAATLVQEKDGTIRLSAADAEVIGESAKIEGGKELNIGFWTNVNDFAQWQVRVDKPGAFEVEVTYACDTNSGDSEYVVVIGNQAVVGKTEVTGSWTNYRTVSLGGIRINDPGVLNAMVRGLRKPGLAVMNLRSVVLKPVAE
ncbi:MAG: alpha-L-fucosidase [Acidobacteriota bacterium]|nr:alpha-L-fucosidase [Acidobacteriota bacterium]